MPGVEPSSRTRSPLRRLALRTVGGLALALSLLPSPAWSQHAPGAPAGGGEPAGTKYPIRIVDRPDTLPHGVTRVDAFGLLQRIPGSPLTATLVFGGGVGITDHLELGGQLVPIQVGPALKFLRPSVYASYSFALSDSIAFVPSAELVYPLHTDEPFFFDLTGDFRFTFDSWGSLDVSPTLSINARGEPFGTAASIPIFFFVQLSDRASVAVASGIGVARFNPRFGVSQRSTVPSFKNLTVPATFQFTWTLPEKTRTQPLVDFTLEFDWPQLYTHTTPSVGLQWTDWTVQVITAWYLIQ